MKTLNSLVAITLLGAASVAGAQVNIPNPQLPGGSYESAVRLVVTNEMMLDRQIKRWLHTHYPGWDADPHEFQDLGERALRDRVHQPRPITPGGACTSACRNTRTKTGQRTRAFRSDSTSFT